MSSTNSQSSAGTARAKPHKELYLPGGDTIFLAENVLFRVYRYFFERESTLFATMFSAVSPGGQVPKGSSDINAIVLDVSATEFADFLWVFYNSRYVYEANIQKWVSILKLAVKWGFSQVTALAIEHLERKDIPDVQKIVLYTTYGVDKGLLAPALLALVKREDPLSFGEGRELGLETALGISRAREQARGKEKKDKGVKFRASADISTSDDEIKQLVQNVLPAEEATSTTNGSASSTSTTTSGASGRATSKTAADTDSTTTQTSTTHGSAKSGSTDPTAAGNSNSGTNAGRGNRGNAPGSGTSRS